MGGAGGYAGSSMLCGISLAVEYRGHSLVAMLSSLTGVAFLAEHRFQAVWASVRDSQALEHRRGGCDAQLLCGV